MTATILLISRSSQDLQYIAVEFSTQMRLILIINKEVWFPIGGGLGPVPQPGIGSACDIFGFCTAFCQLAGPMGAVAQKYPGLLAVGFRPIRASDQQTSMHRQASRNLGPTSEFPRIAEKEAGAKLHLGSICILLAAWDQARQ